MRYKNFSMALIIIVIILVGFHLTVFAQKIHSIDQGNEMSRPMLHDLPGVWVIVEALHTDFERKGLTSSQLELDVQQKLRKAGIKVLTPKEAINVPNLAFLSVFINTYDKLAAQGIYAILVKVDLFQEVSLVRNPKLKAPLVTWSANQLGMVGINRVEDVRTVTLQLVDIFINAYLAENPKNK